MIMAPIVNCFVAIQKRSRGRFCELVKRHVTWSIQLRCGRSIGAHLAKTWRNVFTELSRKGYAGSTSVLTGWFTRARISARQSGANGTPRHARTATPGHA